MLNFGNKEFRNIVQQVAKNQADILELKQSGVVLSEFGIKIVGIVAIPEELPTQESFDGEYGDGYAVGTSTPYTYYVWTRSNDQVPYDHWLNIGVFPQPGPQGEPGATGPQGPQGPAGLGVITKSFDPTAVEGYEIGQT